MLICVFRVTGQGLGSNDAIKNLSVDPYRRELQDGNDVFYYDVADAKTKAEFAEQIRGFLKVQDRALGEIARSERIQHADLDVGMTLQAESFSASFMLDSDIVASAGRYGLAISIACYRSAD